jgi:hypothetical protein
MAGQKNMLTEMTKAASQETLNGLYSVQVQSAEEKCTNK